MDHQRLIRYLIFTVGENAFFQYCPYCIKGLTRYVRDKEVTHTCRRLGNIADLISRIDGIEGDESHERVKTAEDTVNSVQRVKARVSLGNNCNVICLVQKKFK